MKRTCNPFMNRIEYCSELMVEERGRENSMERIILCASSKYEEKYYLNPVFQGLPDAVKDELQAMCVLFTEDIGGILTLEFDEDANLQLNTVSSEDDILYDEIGSVLKIKQIRNDRRELMESLGLYYRIFILGEESLLEIE